MEAARTQRESRVYLGARTNYRTLCCTYTAILLISFTLTLAGFYFLIGHHVEQTIRMSEITSLRIRA